MSTLAVGVMGHVDHGKTALVRALTGTDTDRLAEEKARGISIVLGFAHLDVPRGSVDLIDMPGHERFVRTMVAGATGISALLLVVDAAEGARPQTLEHLEIARALGIRHGVVALAKCDLLAPEARPPAIAAARKLAVEAGLPDVAIVETSARTGEGIAALRDALGALALTSRPPADQGCFWLPIDRVFAIAGFGTVVTGTLRRGRITVGDTVEILESSAPAEPRRAVKVRGLQVHGAAVDYARPGQRVAVNLRGVEANELSSGDALASLGLLAASAWQDVILTLGRDAPDLANGSRLQLLVGTAELPVRLRLLDRDVLAAGERALAQLRLEAPVALPAREPFIVRQPSPARTLGGGHLIRPASGRRRRADPAMLDLLQTLGQAAEAPMTGPSPAALAALLHEAGEIGSTLQALAQRLGTVPAKALKAAEAGGAVLLGREQIMDQAAFERLAKRLLTALAAFHEAEPLAAGMSPSLLQARAAPATPEPVLQTVLARLVADRRMVRAGSHLRGVDLDPSRLQAAAEREAIAAVEARFRDGGLTPPDIASVADTDPTRNKAMHHLVRTGALVRTTDLVQQREIIFHVSAIADAHRRLHAAFPGRAAFLVKEAGATLGISRKYSVPLLEHLDRLKVTRREGDRRTVTKPPGETSA